MYTIYIYSTLDKTNKAILSTTSDNQWKNTSDVTWFKSIPEERASSFLNLDVNKFYPSISMKLFTGTVEYAKTLIEITDQDLAIKMQARKTFQSNHPNALKQ